MRLAKPRIVLVGAELLDGLEVALRLTDGLLMPELHVLDGPGQIHPSHSVLDILARLEYASYYQRHHRSPEKIKSDVAFICFSSGTSGLVKGVQLTHGNVVANVLQQGRCLEDMYQPDTVFTLIVPFFHILGLGGFCIQYICHGAPIVVFRSFDLPKLLESIQRDRVTHVNVVPPIAMAILRSPLTANVDLSSHQRFFQCCRSAEARTSLCTMQPHRLCPHAMVRMHRSQSVGNLSAGRRSTCSRNNWSTASEHADARRGCSGSR